MLFIHNTINLQIVINEFAKISAITNFAYTTYKGVFIDLH